MIILTWNICGIANDTSRNMIRRHCLDFMPDLVGIIEPRVQFSHHIQSFWEALRLAPICQNDRGSRLSNIWVFARDTMNVQMIFSNSQCVVCSFCKIIKRGRLRLFMVLILTLSVIRYIWAVLDAIEGPLMCIGDFNAVCGAHERRSTVMPQQIACRDFENFILKRELLEVVTTGLFYSWSSRRLLPEHVESKIDRALIDQEFMDMWDSVVANLLLRNCSDHSPLIAKCLQNNFSGPRPFRFWNMWTDHENFKVVVNSSWKQPVFSSSAIQKLKRLKPILKDWNRYVFGNVSLEIATLQKKLTDIQSCIARDGYVGDFLDKEVEIQAQLDVRLAQQSTLLKQKSRNHWLRDGDRNTKFFHSCINQSRSRNVIDVLEIDGVLENNAD